MVAPARRAAQAIAPSRTACLTRAYYGYCKRDWSLFGIRSLMPHMSGYLIGCLSLVMAPIAAAQDLSSLEDQLIYGAGPRGDAPAYWRFDPASGTTLGKGLDVRCFRADLIFRPDHTLEFAEWPSEAKGCEHGAMWRLGLDPGTKTYRLEISSAVGDCTFAVRFPPAPTTTLSLSTTCLQQRYAPVEFIYFQPTSAN